MNLSDTRTVMEEAEQAFSHIFELQSRIERMNTELSERTDYESEYYQELIERVSNANEQLALIGASNYQAEIEKTLIGLGFTREFPHTVCRYLLRAVRADGVVPFRQNTRVGE